MQNNQMINLAIMGIGTIGKRHLMAIDTINNVNLCGIIDLTEDARSFCKNNKIPLCLHGEHIHENDDPYEREKRFLDFELSWLVKKFKRLKITLEHITTKDSVDFVKSHKNIAATI